MSTIRRDVSLNPTYLLLPNYQTGSYTFVASDINKVIEVDSTSATNVTVPPNSSVAFEIGTVINVYAANTGIVTVVAGAGVTIRNVGAIADTYGEISLRKRATDEWVMAGDIN